MKLYEKDFFLHGTFLTSSEISVVFNISSHHADNNLPNRHFLQERFLGP